MVKDSVLARKQSIRDNLDRWECMLELGNVPDYCCHLPFRKEVLGFVSSARRLGKPVRLVLLSGSARKNMVRGFSFVKHLILSGVQPSRVTVASLNDCYSSARGFGDGMDARRRIFNRDNQCIVLTGVRERQPADQEVCIQSFWDDFFTYCDLHPECHVLLCCTFTEDRGKRSRRGDMCRRWYMTSSNNLTTVISGNKGRVVDTHKSLGFERF